MSDQRVTLTIDDVTVTVLAGTLIVDAAKQAGIHIPVFCYHPKMEPVGMCRMCLVEIGRPRRERATGAAVLGPDGQPLIDFNPKLETACTTPVGEGWVVRGLTEKPRAGRREVLEFLLTSHPLDCPVCDKGGECPLQNLTMAHGPGKSRFVYDEKMHLAKHVPLGELIVLDRERCIQCGRCVRFQDEIVGEPVIGFFERGRKLEIVSFSEPGFDSVFSGNTTDICPVGALTTTDFRFEARPWELHAAASICTHCPVGCNLTLNIRRQPNARGQILVQRVMPRQNEAVNEIWICDKGRFGHHFAASPERLNAPLVRKDGRLVEVGWDEALVHAADGLRRANGRIIGLGGGRAANEDLYQLRALVEGLGGRTALSEWMAGGALVQHFGAGSQFDFGRLGAGDAVLVLASDLQEEAPLWWLRIKQAADRGAAVYVAGVRPTRLEAHATHTLRYPAGEAVKTALGLLHAVRGGEDLAGFRGDDSLRAVGTALKEARELVVLYGREALDAAGTEALARACAGLLTASGHAGRPGSGLIAVWPKANTQGAWEIGLRPQAAGLAAALAGAAAALIVAADPAGDDPALAESIEKAGFVVVQELFLTETARRADVVFPAQAFTEREGSFTSGERRVQRFFPAVPPRPGTRPDWLILADLGERLGLSLVKSSASAVFDAMAAEIVAYAGLSYQALSWVEPQWPIAGGDDLYYGGTAYRNDQGLGAKLPALAERGATVEVPWVAPAEPPSGGDVLLIPVDRLLDAGTTLRATKELDPRRARAQAMLNAQDAAGWGVADGDEVEAAWDGRTARLAAVVSEAVPAGCVLIPRSVGVPLDAPAAGNLVAARERA